MKQLLHFLCCMWLCCVYLPSIGHTTNKEYNVEARHIHNLTKYVDWPAQAIQSNFVIGIIGNTQTAKTLQYNLQQEMAFIDGKPVLVECYTNTQMLEKANPQVLIVMDSTLSTTNYIKQYTINKPVFTIGYLDCGLHTSLCAYFKRCDKKKLILMKFNKGILQLTNLTIDERLGLGQYRTLR